MDFEQFDKKINKEEMQKSIEEAVKNGGTGYAEVPKDSYHVKLDSLELGTTKDNRPMVKGQFRILEGKFKKSCLFYNRVIYGTKNDANMIASVLGFINKLEPSEDVGPIVFEKYSQFADLLLDVAEDVADALEYDINYDPDAFNSISITDVYEV